MSNITKQYELTLDEAIKSILAVGTKRTVIMQGHMGIGKSSSLTMLGEALPDHTQCYFDCTTKDLGDIFIPKMKSEDGSDFVTFAPNEELGAHLDKPIILMVDEFGKANPSVQKAMLRIMLERKIGSYTLHPDSIVYATTNLGAEGVGDLLPPHACNRIIVTKLRKPSAVDVIEYGISNGFNTSVLGFVKEFPHCLDSFEDVKDPSDNPYIFHPREKRAAFVTPRSLEAASDILNQREELNDQIVTSLLIGTIGARAALDMMSFVRLVDQLPTLDSITNEPYTALIPESASGVCMVIYKLLGAIDAKTVDPIMDYVNRLDTEAQALFSNTARSNKYKNHNIVMTNRKFTDWAMKNGYMFSADQQ